MRPLFALVLSVAPVLSAATTPLLPFLREGEEGAARFCFATASAHYTASAAGRITTRGGVSTKVPIDRGEYLEQAWMSPLGRDVLLAYEATKPGDYTYGQLCRLHGTTLAKRWCSNIDGFNVVVALDDIGHAYVGSIGTVGKVNLADGRYLWRKRGLYARSTAYNIFGVPVVVGEEITFLATAGTHGGAEKTLTLSAKSGKLLRENDALPAGKEVIGLQRAQGSCS